MIYNYLAIGDSYTCGEAVEPDVNFPSQLVKGLRAQGVDLADPTIVATTGWTTEELAAGIDAADLHPPYDIVTLLIGVNNQYRGPAKGYTKDQYRRELFRQLLRQAIHLAGNKPDHVVVLSIPDWGAMPAGREDRATIGGEIDAYNAINREITDSNYVPYLDITPISRRALEDDTLVADDDLHPSAAMYAQWVALLQPIVLDALQG